MAQSVTRYDYGVMELPVLVSLLHTGVGDEADIRRLDKLLENGFRWVRTDGAVAVFEKVLGPPDDSGGPRPPNIAFGEWRIRQCSHVRKMLNRHKVESWDGLYCLSGLDILSTWNFGSQSMGKLIDGIKAAGGVPPDSWFDGLLT